MTQAFYNCFFSFGKRTFKNAQLFNIDPKSSFLIRQNKIHTLTPFKCLNDGLRHLQDEIVYFFVP